MAQRAEHLKISKYAHLDSSHHFIPVAVETLGVFGPGALSFIQDLSRCLRQVTGEPRSLEYLLQRISVAVLLFLGRWEGQLDWRLLLARCTLHYLFVYFVFVFCFYFLIVFYIASSIVLSVIFSCCTVIIIINCRSSCKLTICLLFPFPLKKINCIPATVHMSNPCTCIDKLN